MDIFFGGGGHHKIRLYLGVISMHFGSFFKVKVQNGGIFFFFFGGGGVLKFPNINGGS